MTCYFATFEPDGDGFLVTFPDIPEAISGGDTLAEARAKARDALEVALLTYVLDGRTLPEAGAREGDPIATSAQTAVKIAFIEAFRTSGLTRVALAERLGVAEGEVRRMLDPYHATKLARLEEALQALGKRLVVTVEAA